MLGGRFPILVILVLGLVVAGTKGVPWLLKQLREPTPVFRVDDVRNQRYVAPYDQWPEPGREYPMTVSVHGPAVSARYQAKMPQVILDAIPPKPRWVIDAESNQVVVLPDGRTFGIGAILKVPSKSLAGERGEYSMEEVYHHPNGHPMTREEALDFRRKHGQSVDDSHRWGHADMTYGIQLYFETDLDLDEFVELSIRDLQTGGRAVSESPRSSPGPQRFSNAPGLVYQIFSLVPVRPSSLAIHALLWQGEKETLRFPPNAPQSLEFASGKMNVRAVAFQRDHDSGVVTMSGKLVDSDILEPVLVPNVWFFFNELPNNVRWIHVQLKDGRWLSAYERNGSVALFNCDFEDIKTVEVIAQLGVAHVVFKLPQFPETPKRNFAIEDVREMEFPPTSLPAWYSHYHALSQALQIPYSPSFDQTVAPPPVLADLEGMTVGELLELELSRYPEYEIAILESPFTDTQMLIVPTNTMRSHHSPLLSRIYRFLSNTWQLLLIAAVILALLKGWILLRARDLHRLLRVRGYVDWTFWDAERAYIGLGKRAWNIPSKDELGSLPGVDATDVRSVVRFVSEMEGREC